MRTRRISAVAAVARRVAGRRRLRIEQSSSSSSSAAAGGGSSSSSSSSSSARAAASATLNGAGSTLAAPIYQQWGSTLKSQGLTINFNPVGSGAGIADLQARHGRSSPAPTRR